MNEHDDIGRLRRLRQEGLLSEEEFQAAADRASRPRAATSTTAQADEGSPPEHQQPDPPGETRPRSRVFVLLGLGAGVIALLGVYFLSQSDGDLYEGLEPTLAGVETLLERGGLNVCPREPDDPFDVQDRNGDGVPDAWWVKYVEPCDTMAVNADFLWVAEPEGQPWVPDDNVMWNWGALTVAVSPKSSEFERVQELFDGLEEATRARGAAAGPTPSSPSTNPAARVSHTPPPSPEPTTSATSEDDLQVARRQWSEMGPSLTSDIIAAGLGNVANTVDEPQALVECDLPRDLDIERPDFPCLVWSHPSQDAIRVDAHLSRDMTLEVLEQASQTDVPFIESRAVLEKLVTEIATELRSIGEDYSSVRAELEAGTCEWAATFAESSLCSLDLVGDPYGPTQISVTFEKDYPTGQDAWPSWDFVG